MSNVITAVELQQNRSTVTSSGRNKNGYLELSPGEAAVSFRRAT